MKENNFMTTALVNSTGQIGFKNAQHAFEFWFEKIAEFGDLCQDTLALRNIGFYIMNPLDNNIKTNWRKWNPKYAEREWNWYLTHSRDVSELQKYAPTWKNMHNGDCQVNSNYGWLWSRNKQLDKVMKMLSDKPNTRKAYITLYDGKEIDNYDYDTPCTLNIGFSVEKNKLNMEVLMRSNDLIFGFCNDQYCFSQLQTRVAAYLDLEVGTYYHYASNLHIYSPYSKVYPSFINEKVKEIW